MAEAKLNPEVDEFLSKPSKWTACYQQLRRIVLDCGLTEDFKWMHPCYTVNGKNVVLIHGFKAYCALLFHKGALLKDPDGLLVQQTEHVQAGRQLRFTSAEEIVAKEALIKAYIQEAVAAEKAGLKVTVKKQTEPDIPAELQAKFAELPELQPAFEALTPGRRNAYMFYFSQAKRSATRTARIEKNVPRILQGKGLHDCICGHSKRMPTCDGSHKENLAKP